MADIKIPALGESVAGGQISKWHFKVGDAVKIGDVLLTLETDKVAAEVTAEVSGVLASINNKEGDDVLVAGVVGTITEGAAVAEKAESKKQSSENGDQLSERPLSASDANQLSQRSESLPEGL